MGWQSSSFSTSGGAVSFERGRKDGWAPVSAMLLISYASQESEQELANPIGLIKRNRTLQKSKTGFVKIAFKNISWV